MIKRKKSQSIIFAILQINGFKTLGLLVLLTIPFVQLISPLSPRDVYADTMLNVHGGFGDFEIKTTDDMIQSISKNNRRHLGIGMNLEKEGYPLKVSFKLGFFETEEETEKWTIGPLHENRLDINGGTFDVEAFVTPYTYSSSKDGIRIKPFLGGGLGYKRYKFERKGLKENMLTDPNAFQYFLGNQAVTTIGVTPHIGFSLELPRLGMECSLRLGWSFHAAKSNIDYHVFPEGNEPIHSYTIHTSGSSLVTGMQVFKRWESFSVALGFVWEKIRIYDKQIPYDVDGDGEIKEGEGFLFPEFEITQTFGQISINYLF
jgi:hypothetical protein